MFAGDYPLPPLSAEKAQRPLLAVAIDFIQAPTWSESKRFLETHPELLQPEIDILLQELAKQQEHNDVRKAIEGRRILLAKCRDKGIDTAFAEIQMVQSPEVTYAADLNRFCNEMVTALRAGHAEQREVLATRVEQMLKDDIPIEGARDFLVVLLAWLRRQDVQLLTAVLSPPFREAYTRLVAMVEQEEAEDTGENDTLALESLLEIVFSVLVEGTTEQRQQTAARIVEIQQQLPQGDAGLGRFLGCLVEALEGETPDIALLEPPFMQLWQEFQERLHTSPDASSQQEEGNDG